MVLLTVTRQQLNRALEVGQPGSLERLAYWLDLDVRSPDDNGGYSALVEYMELGVYLDYQAACYHA